MMPEQYCSSGIEEECNAKMQCRVSSAGVNVVFYFTSVTLDSVTAALAPVP